ncbi:MAG: MATE family efflux transporter [Oscillospiraceae bacterium]|jgi:putative MATE family efflux protein|nr:MATE family efflux transporter [Oscillospiraceae bacterium]
MDKPTAGTAGLTRRLMKLAVPIILQNLINSSLMLIDTFMVGTLGETELAALTLANTWFFVISLFIFGVQSGMTVLVGQYWGRGDRDAINRLLGIGFVLGGSFSFLICGVIALFPLQTMSLTTSSPSIAAVAAEYAQIVAPSLVLNSFTMMILGAQRAMENPRMGMNVLVMSMSVSTILNYFLIFGIGPFPELGVRGAALATLLARILEIGVTFVFSARDTRFIMKPRLMLRPGRVLWKDYLRICLPVIGNEALWGLGFSLFPIILAYMPSNASGVAAYAIALNIERVAAALYFGVGHAIAVVVCKELGSGRKEGMYAMGKALLRRVLVAGSVAGGLLAVLTAFIIAPYMIPLFAESTETEQLARLMLLISCIAAPARAVNFTIIVGILRGGGDTKAAMIIDIISMYALAVPLAALAGLVFQWGALAVFCVMVFEEVWKFAVAWWRFKQKKWIRDVTRPALEEGEDV